MDMEIVHTIASITSGALTLYYWLNIIAILLTWVNADPFNPFVLNIRKIVLPFWDWVARYSPRSLGAFSAYLALLVIIFLQNVIPIWIRSLGGYALDQLTETALGNNLLFTAGFGAAIVLYQLIWFVFILSVIWFILTLVNPPMNNPIVRTIMLLLDPLLTPLQRLLPRAKIDLSPIVLAISALVISGLMESAAGYMRYQIIPV